MQLRSFLAVAVTSALLGFAAPQPAKAFDFGWEADPYAYRYSPRGYYPYYNSGYWGPPRKKRFRGELPPYFAAWGAPDRYYRHVEWHNRHYGGHRHHHW